MSYKDDVKFGMDSDGNLTMTAIDYNDHKGMGPHAHDVDMSKPFSDFNSARGKARELTEDERREYLGDNCKSSSSGDSNSTNKSENSSSCYLTTACLKHLSDQFDDNCHELTVLRWFRDHFVKADDIAIYYNIAPTIVKNINALPAKEQDKVYSSIYENIVNACVRFIENGQYDDAYERYLSSTLMLLERFLQ